METQAPTEQAPAPSVQERVANIFSPPTQSEPKEPEAQQPTETASEPTEAQPSATAPVEETFELEIEGEKYVLPKKLEKGYMQDRDYTQKTQTLADQRRAIEHMQEQARISQIQQEFHKEVAQDLQQLQALDWAINQAVDLNSMPLEEAIKEKFKRDSWKDERQKLIEKIEGKRGEWGQKQQAELDKLRTSSLETLQKRIPGWSQDLAKAVREHALSDGYTESELASIIDPRHAVTLWKASQFDKLQANAKPAVQTAKTVKTTPTTPMPQETKDYLNYRKTLSKTAPGSQERRRAVEDRIAAKFGR